MSEKKSDFLVTLPSMGEGVQEATLNKWLCQVGEEVKKDEPLLEISTDKVDTEIMSPYSGYLIATHVKEGSTVGVGDTIAQVSLKKTAAVLEVTAPKQTTGKSTGPSTETERPERLRPIDNLGSFMPRQASSKSFAGPIKSSPLVRKMAFEMGVPLGEVQGTGAYARITKDDILDYIARNSSSEAPQNLTESLASASLATEKKEGKEFLEGVEVTREPMSKIRKATADHMIRSVRTSPHVTTTFEICLDPVLALKKAKSENFQKKHGIKLTLTPFFIAACAKALEEHPHVNASVDGYDILLKKDVNIACAVATNDGLMVPVLKRLQGLSFTEIVTRFSEMVQKTRDKKLQLADLAGGSFSITNPGMYGSLHSQPIINQPQVAILSVGAMTKRCVFDGKEPRNETVCQIGLTFDHRLIDGQLGAFFLQSVKREMERVVL